MVIETKPYQLKNIITIKSYLQNIINCIRKTDIWEIQLTTAVNFISSKDNDEERVIHSKGDNIEIMINDKPEDIIEDPFQSLFSSYQIGLETS